MDVATARCCPLYCLPGPCTLLMILSLRWMAHAEEFVNLFDGVKGKPVEVAQKREVGTTLFTCNVLPARTSLVPVYHALATNTIFYCAQVGAISHARLVTPVRGGWTRFPLRRISPRALD